MEAHCRRCAKTSKFSPTLTAVSTPDSAPPSSTTRTLLPQNYDDARRRKGDLEALTVIAQRYENLESFLTDIAIDPPDLRRGTGSDDSEDEWITVSTIHSAKGLEWHSVFVVNLTNGHFPGRNSLDDPVTYEEERRLLYVAVTRAKRGLYLMKPEQVAGRGLFGGSITETSALLQDIPGLDSLVERKTFSAPPRDENLSQDSGAGLVAINEERLKRIQDYFDD